MDIFVPYCHGPSHEIESAAQVRKSKLAKKGSCQWQIHSTLSSNFSKPLVRGTSLRHVTCSTITCHFAVQSIHFTSQSRIWKRSKNSNPLSNELMFSRCSQTATMYVCCTIWLQTLLSAPRLFANGIRSEAIRSRLFAP